MAKRAADIVMKVPGFFVFLVYMSLSLIVGRKKSFSAVMQGVSLFPGISGEWFRRAVLQWVTGRRLENCCISFGCLFSDPAVTIGDGTYLGSRCDIGNTDIGDDCIIGSGVHVMSGMKQHSFDRMDVPIRDQGGVFETVSVGSGTWIGNGALICADVGKGCVIGAGSVVVSPVPDYAVAAGNPADIIRYRRM